MEYTVEIFLKKEKKELIEEVKTLKGIIINNPVYSIDTEIIDEICRRIDSETKIERDDSLVKILFSGEENKSSEIEAMLFGVLNAKQGVSDLAYNVNYEGSSIPEEIDENERYKKMFSVFDFYIELTKRTENAVLKLNVETYLENNFRKNRLEMTKTVVDNKIFLLLKYTGFPLNNLETIVKRRVEDYAFKLRDNFEYKLVKIN